MLTYAANLVFLIVIEADLKEVVIRINPPPSGRLRYEKGPDQPRVDQSYSKELAVRSVHIRESELIERKGKCVSLTFALLGGGC